MQDLFHRALDVPEGERDRWLESACGDDVDLRDRIGSLLRQDGRPSSVLDDPKLPPSVFTDPKIGCSFGPYLVTERIAVGGMGVVYRAERRDGQFERDVALKLVRPDVSSAEGLRRFDEERRTLATLEHPNIARLYDGGTTEHGEPYLVMEFVDGRTLDRYCDEERLSIEDRLRLFSQTCRAVHFAHQRLVVHRDIKPGNVLVDRRGVPKLLDFGIARLLESDGEAPAITRTGARILTPEYASPEQLAGESLTTATDVYSLGVVLYGLLTGRRPYGEKSRSLLEWERTVKGRAPTRPSAVLDRSPSRGSRASEDDPTSSVEARASMRRTTPARLRRRLKGDLDRIVMNALRTEPERRYPSAFELAEDVERYLRGDAVGARSDSFWYRTSKLAARHRLALIAGSLVIAALSTGLWLALRAEHRAEAEAEHARIEAVSFSGISRFLLDTFLASELVETQEQRDWICHRLDQQVARVRRQYADDAHLRANFIDELGNVFLTLDRFDEAQALVDEAYEIRRTEFGARSLEVALSLNRKGELQYRKGELGQAVETFRRALELHRELPHGTHTDVATAANNLAACLRGTGAIEEAEALHREALAMRRSSGSDRVAVAESLNNLAGIHLARREYEEAAAMLQETLDLRMSVLGEEHSLTLQGMSNLGIALVQSGRTDEGLELLERAAKGYAALGAEGREGHGRVLSVLSGAAMAGGRWEAAEDHARRSLELQEERLGLEHPDLIPTLVRLARIQRARSDLSGALITFERVAAIHGTAEASIGADTRVVQALVHFAEALLAARQDSRAIEVLAGVVQQLEESDDSLADLHARAESYLGRAYARTGAVGLAEEHLQRAIDRLRSAPGDQSKEIERIERALEELRSG